MSGNITAVLEKKDKIEEIIDRNIVYLVDHIEVANNVLWEKLIEYKVFTNFDVDNIKVSISLNKAYKYNKLCSMYASKQFKYLNIEYNPLDKNY